MSLKLFPIIYATYKWETKHQINQVFNISSAGMAHIDGSIGVVDQNIQLTLLFSSYTLKQLFHILILRVVTLHRDALASSCLDLAGEITPTWLLNHNIIWTVKWNEISLPNWRVFKHEKSNSFTNGSSNMFKSPKILIYHHHSQSENKTFRHTFTCPHQY